MADDPKNKENYQVLLEYVPDSKQSDGSMPCPSNKDLESISSIAGDSQQGLTQINTHLLCYGFPTISLCSPTETGVSLNLVLNLVRLLLIQRQKDMTYRDDIADTISRLKSENSMLAQKLKKLDSTKSRLDKELISAQRNAEAVEQDFQKQRLKLQTELRTLTAKYTQLQYQTQTLIHKKNRGEKELEAAKEKLLKFSHPFSASSVSTGDSVVGTAPKIEVLNTSFNENDFKEHTRSLAYNTSVIKDISEVYESRLQEFLQEITKLQDTLSIFCSRLGTLVEQYSAVRS